jgi:hypothetical protein
LVGVDGLGLGTMLGCSAGVDEVSTSTGKAHTAPWTQIGAVGGGVDSLGASYLTPSLAQRHAMLAPLAATRALRLSMDMRSSELGVESRELMVENTENWVQQLIEQVVGRNFWV